MTTVSFAARLASAAAITYQALLVLLIFLRQVVAPLEVERIGTLRNRVLAPHTAQGSGPTRDMSADMANVMKR